MLHFAPRYGIISPCLNWGKIRKRDMRLPIAANDTGAARTGRSTGANDLEAHDEALLEAALRMFAAHGLSAAQRACEAAEIAGAGGDSAGAEWWIAVCGALDGPLARSAQRAFAARATSQG
jgi:hypothetical protein